MQDPIPLYFREVPDGPKTGPTHDHGRGGRLVGVACLNGRAQPPADADYPERGLLLRLNTPGADPDDSDDAGISGRANMRRVDCYGKPPDNLVGKLVGTGRHRGALAAPGVLDQTPPKSTE